MLESDRLFMLEAPEMNSVLQVGVLEPEVRCQEDHCKGASAERIHLIYNINSAKIHFCINAFMKWQE